MKYNTRTLKIVKNIDKKKLKIIKYKTNINIINQNINGIYTILSIWDIKLFKILKYILKIIFDII